VEKKWRRVGHRDKASRRIHDGTETTRDFELPLSEDRKRKKRNHLHIPRIGPKKRRIKETRSPFCAVRKNVRSNAAVRTSFQPKKEESQAQRERQRRRKKEAEHRFVTTKRGGWAKGAQQTGIRNSLGVVVKLEVG